jgi:diguanylate cyclase (GGDEF)-like protein
MLVQVNSLPGNRQNRVFIEMIVINIAVIIIDLITWYIDGKTGSFYYVLIRVCYILLYTLPFLPSYLFTVYVYDLLQVNIFKLRGLMACITLCFTADLILAVLSLNYGLFFSISADNHYMRGSLFLLHAAFCVIFFLYTFVLICVRRKSFSSRFFYTLLLFFLPQTAGIIIQGIFYGYTTNWIGMMLSLLVIYMNIQSRNLNTDYLTGINNRRYLDEYIAGKIKRASERKTFTALMIDIDNFKAINDTYGHDTGDMALKDTAQILLKSSKRDDFVARTGGDEFIVVVDSANYQTDEDPAALINKNVDNFNRHSKRPYVLSFSIGQHTYIPNSGLKANELLKLIDRSMYEIKSKKSTKVNS